MATRRELDIRKLELMKHLRGLSESDSAMMGVSLPSHRVLASQFGISTYTVFATIKTLVNEGVLHSQAGVGVFARKPNQRRGVFALIVKETVDQRVRQMYEGFVSELAANGMASMVITAAEAMEWQQRPDCTSEIQGVFSLHANPEAQNGKFIDVPTVGFYEHTNPCWDSVVFDDQQGGRLATQHLIDCGHREIAFLGTHYPDQNHSMSYSYQRALGWQEALDFHEPKLHGKQIRNLLSPEDSSTEVGMNAVDRFLEESTATGVVAANNLVASGFIAGLRERKIPRSTWPAIVGFQDSDTEVALNFSAIQVSYHALGRAVALRLIQRLAVANQDSTVDPSPVIDKVKMRLIPSITSYTGWAVRTPTQARSLAKFGTQISQPA